MIPTRPCIRLEVETPPHSKDPNQLIYCLTWDAQTQVSGAVFRCGSFQELDDVVRGLKNDLDGVLRQAKEAVEHMQALSAQDKEKSMDPSDIWRQMEQAPTEAAMFSFFNGLSEHKRMEVAEWILTHVGMFKGRGPVFAEHYNIVTHTLDE